MATPKFSEGQKVKFVGKENTKNDTRVFKVVKPNCKPSYFKVEKATKTDKAGIYYYCAPVNTIGNTFHGKFDYIHESMLEIYSKSPSKPIKRKADAPKPERITGTTLHDLAGYKAKKEFRVTRQYNKNDTTLAWDRAKEKARQQGGDASDYINKELSIAYGKQGERKMTPTEFTRDNRSDVHNIAYSRRYVNKGMRGMPEHDIFEDMFIESKGGLGRTRGKTAKGSKAKNGSKKKFNIFD